MGRKSASGSGMNNSKHIFLSLETIFFGFFGVKILKFFDEDPGWRQFGSGMEKKSDPGSGINIPDLQHWSRDGYFFKGLYHRERI
jgi:hypothetical protein